MNYNQKQARYPTSEIMYIEKFIPLYILDDSGKLLKEAIKWLKRKDNK